MYKSKVLVAGVLMIYVLFAIFEFNGNKDLAYYLHSLIIPSITVTYLLLIKKKNLFFLLFLVCYSVSDLLSLILEALPYSNNQTVLDIDYYLGNSLYILAYFFLFLKVSYSLSLMHVLRNFKIHLVVLTILNIYLVYVLQIIIKPFLEVYNEYAIELAYNIMMFLFLSAALLNYFFRDNKKSLYLFLGALCIVFAEVIHVAHIYIAEKSLLIFISTSLDLIAFYFFFQQSKMLNKMNEEETYMISE